MTNAGRVDQPAAADQGARACPLCGARGAAPCLRAERRTPAGEPYQVLACPGCGVRYTHPLPPAAELAALYTEEFYGGCPGGRLSWESLRRALHRVVLRHRRRALLGRRPGRVLDVGCGDGDFLAYLQGFGWAGYGTEFSEAACALARSRGVVVQEGSLRGAGFPEGFFDVVTMWHVLEHLPDPAAELAEARRVLRADGLLILEVPNLGCLTFRLCRGWWWPLDVPRHLLHFTPETLGRLLDAGGFEVLRRQDFHAADAALSFMSFVNRLGLIGRLQGDHYFVTDYRRASAAKQASFLLLAPLIGLFSVPYSALATLLSRNGETVTITAGKVGP